MSMHYRVEKWCGPKQYDYKLVKDHISKEKALSIIRKAGDMNYNYSVSLYKYNIEIHGGYELLGMINGEEFILNSDDIEY